MKTGTCESCGAENQDLNRLDNEYDCGVNFCVCDDCLETIKSDFEDSQNELVRKEVEEVSETGPWKVVKTRFHGGGILLESDNIDEIIESVRNYRSGDCVCGCCGVIAAGAQLCGTETNDHNGYSPYQLTN